MSSEPKRTSAPESPPQEPDPSPAAGGHDADPDPGRATAIGEHGLIGDMETIGLVGRGATLEWLCWPRFDSPSVFGRLLDPDGGHWSIGPVGSDWTDRQLYLPDTNVLLTRFHTPSGLVEVEDFMALGGLGRGVVRRVTGVRGTVSMRSEMLARPDYGRLATSLERSDDGILIDGPDERWLASSSIDLTIDGEVVSAAFDVTEGDSIVFAFGMCDVELCVDDLADRTAMAWRDWIGQNNYRGRWREVVERSALVLKLLTHAESGGVLAAGTTSLPEEIGGERNWDYRYVWIRDAAFTLYAFNELGFTAEAAAFTTWLSKRLDENRGDHANGPLAPLYDLDGNSDLAEIELDHWAGYRGSRPVRVGNAASDQLQLDIYGELLDSMYLADKHGSGLSLDTWNELRHLVDWVCAHWDQPDEGMWEVRSGRQRYTSSALMCWVALERGIRMANFRGRPADLDRWRRTRDEIHETILTRGWSEELGAFTQTFDGDTLDASLLLMPLVKFVSGTDPRWLSTLDAIGEQLVHGVLVDRYDNEVSDDGLRGNDGSFSICSFWYVENLVRAGRVDEARLRFEKMLTYAGPLGLFSEVISLPGAQLGNYPQAFTHLSLISAAIHLDEALHGDPT